MKLHETETANTLTTATQTKNAGPAHRSAPGRRSANAKNRRLAAKKRCIPGTNRRRGTREASHPKAGTTRTMAAKVAVKSHGMRATPARTLPSSRIGRRT